MLMQQHPEPRPLLPQTTPTVDAVYINRARALIMELRAMDVLAQCDAETTLSHTPTPAVTSADVCLATSVAQATQRQSSRQLTHSVSQSYAGDSNELAVVGGVARDSPFRSPRGLRSRSQSALTKPTLRSLRRNSSKTGVDVSQNDAPPPSHPRSSRPPYTLTAGVENLLLHYVCLVPGQGVMMLPSVAAVSGGGGGGGGGQGGASLVGSVQAKLLQCFQHTSLTISEVLRGRRRMWNGTDSEINSETDSDSGGEEGDGEVSKKAANVFAPRRSRVIEHGVLVECSAPPGLRAAPPGGSLKGGQTSLCYWVVG